MTSVSTLFRLWRQRAQERRVSAQFSGHGLWDLASRAATSLVHSRTAAPSLWRERRSARADVINSGDPASAPSKV
jgi:hypothetical protein